MYLSWPRRSSPSRDETSANTTLAGPRQPTTESSLYFALKDRSSRESSIVETGGHDGRFIARRRLCVPYLRSALGVLSPLPAKKISITSTPMHSIIVYIRKGAGGEGYAKRCVIMINVVMSQTSEHFTLVSLQTSRPRLARTSPTRLSHSSLERAGSYILHAKVRFSRTDRNGVGSRGERGGGGREEEAPRPVGSEGEVDAEEFVYERMDSTSPECPSMGLMLSRIDYSTDRYCTPPITPRSLEHQQAFR